MGLKKIDLKSEYRSLKDDIMRNFYIPALSESILYKRAVGFFSSSALIEMSVGIVNLIKNNGRIELIVSPRLSDEDITAISRGYKEREKVIEMVLINSFTEPENYFDEERLNILAHLIAEGRLDIKVAVTKNSDEIGIYHEKIGLIYDKEGNKVAFTGSMNETMSAFKMNYESIDVFCSWTEENKRVEIKEAAFNRLWANIEAGVDVIDFPKVAIDKINTYKKEEINTNLDYEQFPESGEKEIKPRIPSYIKLHDYQIEAIEKWKESGYKGIFDMATGTGKTITGIAGIIELYKSLNKKLAVIIVCPYQHLVEQWVEDLISFNIKPVIGYSASKQNNWKKRLKDSIINYNLEIIDFFCFITTNATFSSDYVKGSVNDISGKTLLVVDEAHNFGAEKLSGSLNEKIEYRLALSATLERHGDESGTNKLYEYFGDKCIEYSLERAIKEDKLTPYFYYPVVTYLNDRELEKYKKITKEIIKGIIKKSDGTIEVKKSAEILLIERARIIAGSSDKILKLRKVIEKYKTENHLLIYCGATKTSIDEDANDGDSLEFDLRQIDVVCNLLGNELGMRVSQFTSKESSQEREIIKHEFDSGDHIQALVAIRCLDEGVNIPNIQKAFILASSTNPKEYIQRRGRVLRKASGKKYAYIFDFVTLPRPLDDVISSTEEELKYDLSLIKKEIIRMQEFSAIAENPSDTDNLIFNIKDAYNLMVIGRDDYGI